VIDVLGCLRQSSDDRGRQNVFFSFYHFSMGCVTPRLGEIEVFRGIDEPRKSDRLLGVNKPSEVAVFKVALLDGFYTPNKRSDFRVSIRPLVFDGLNIAVCCGFSSDFFPWGYFG
jgi:hypothetical protein